MTAIRASAAQPTVRCGPRSAILVTAAAALVAGSLLVGTGRADAQSAAPTQLVASSKPGSTKPVANDEASDFKFPGLDTLALPDGSQRYISYGASAAGRQVPFSIHGQGADASPSAKIDGDAMPGGGGKWTKGGGIWAPAAYYHPGTHRYYLFYTASRAVSVDRKCIGVASSASPTKDFRAADAPLVCPTKGTRWALDADVVQGPEGAVWMVWRDGQRAIGAQSAISAMMLKFGDNGGVTGSSEPRVILRTDHLPWTDNDDGKGVVVAENPAAFFHQGSWYLMYSGNSWPTNKYATGVAYCGMSIAGDVCTPIPGPNQAYFAYDGPDGLPAGQRVKGLPGNKRGPGAMEVFTAHDGQLWVGWNYITDSDRNVRRSRTATLTITGRGASAKFDVGVRTQLSANCQTVPEWVQMLLPQLYNHCQPVVWDPAPTPKKKGFEQPKSTKKGFEQPKPTKKAWEQPEATPKPTAKSQPHTSTRSSTSFG